MENYRINAHTPWDMKSVTCVCSHAVLRAKNAHEVIKSDLATALRFDKRHAYSLAVVSVPRIVYFSFLGFKSRITWASILRPRHSLWLNLKNDSFLCTLSATEILQTFFDEYIDYYTNPVEWCKIIFMKDMLEKINILNIDRQHSNLNQCAWPTHRVRKLEYWTVQISSTKLMKKILIVEVQLSQKIITFSGIIFVNLKW